jgi:hypothetical protein
MTFTGRALSFHAECTCIQLLFGAFITATCFSVAFHSLVLCMHNSDLVADGSGLMWDSVLFLLHILKK